VIIVIIKNRVFCFQCEQTAGCKGYTGGAGVCGKNFKCMELIDIANNESNGAPLCLGVKNIFLGLSLTTFAALKVLNFHFKNYNTVPISTSEADIKIILG